MSPEVVFYDSRDIYGLLRTFKVNRKVGVPPERDETH